jgi:hypothetical protein
VVADRAAAEALAELYSGADVVRLPFASLIPESAKAGRRRVHASNAARNVAYRDRRKADLLAQLEEVNRSSSETKLPYSYKDISSLTDAAFGGSLFHDVGRKHPQPIPALSGLPTSLTGCASCIAGRSRRSTHGCGRRLSSRGRMA